MNAIKRASVNIVIGVLLLFAIELLIVPFVSRSMANMAYFIGGIIFSGISDLVADIWERP